MPTSIIRRKNTTRHSLSDSMHPVLRRIYSARNITSSDELDYSLRGLLPYQKLKDIDRAVPLLVKMLEKQKQIIIVADFDADGATSCALAIRGLKLFGANHLDYIVPSRFEFDYGLSPEIVQLLAEQKPELIITVDNGISSIEGVALARKLGIDILITDHHLPGPQLPDATAIVNPNQSGDGFPCKSLAGVGVMFYVLIALRAALRENGWFKKHEIAEPNLAVLLDLVALGTVADVVPLDFNNRILVSQGLARIRSDCCVPGIKALLQVAKRTHSKVRSSDLGYVVGPRLNAAGRITHMSLGIECLLCDDPQQAFKLASELNDLNLKRRDIQHGMQELADEEMQKLENDDDLPFGLCLYNAEWHQGVVGILASRMKDKWRRPVIVFAQDRDGLIKGSGRSIGGLHILNALDTISTQNPGMITKFGGHAMAAGLTIHERDFESFRFTFEREVESKLTIEDLQCSLLSDGELIDSEITLSLAEEINLGGPWGQDFPEPLFDGIFQLADRQIVGEHHLKMSLSLPEVKNDFEAIAFFTLDDDWPEEVDHVQLAYRLDVNEFRGRKSLQMIVEHIDPLNLVQNEE